MVTGVVWGCNGFKSRFSLILVCWDVHTGKNWAGFCGVPGAAVGMNRTGNLKPRAAQEMWLHESPKQTFPAAARQGCSGSDVSPAPRTIPAGILLQGALAGLSCPCVLPPKDLP